MKKGLMLSIICLLFLTGCSRKMTCTYNYEENEVAINSKIIITYDQKNKAIKQFSRTTTLKLKNKDYISKFSSLSTQIKDKYNDLKNELEPNYFKSYLRITKKKITLNENYKFNKMQKEDFIKTGFNYYKVADNAIYLENVEEDLNYVCK